MKKTKFKDIIHNVQTAMKKHSPEILTGIGIAGMITTVVMAVRATPKAIFLLEEKKEEKGDKKLTVPETIKTAWTCYIPSTIVGSVSILCLVGASSVNFRRNAALATAYTLSESALREYQEKVVETIGEKKEQSIRDAIATDRLNADPVTNREVIITSSGNTLCYDAISGRYFKSDIEKIRKVENELNRRMMDEMFISLNDFYYEIGLDGIDLGEALGWNIEKGYIDLSFSSQLAKDGTPCLVILYSLSPPQYDYQK